MSDFKSHQKAPGVFNNGSIRVVWRSGSERPRHLKGVAMKDNKNGKEVSGMQRNYKCDARLHKEQVAESDGGCTRKTLESRDELQLRAACRLGVCGSMIIVGFSEDFQNVSPFKKWG